MIGQRLVKGGAWGNYVLGRCMSIRGIGYWKHWKHKPMIMIERLLCGIYFFSFTVKLIWIPPGQ